MNNLFIMLGEKAHYRNMDTTRDDARTVTKPMAKRFQKELQQRIGHTLQDFNTMYDMI